MLLTSKYIRHNSSFPYHDVCWWNVTVIFNYKVLLWLEYSIQRRTHYIVYNNQTSSRATVSVMLHQFFVQCCLYLLLATLAIEGVVCFYTRSTDVDRSNHLLMFNTVYKKTSLSGLFSSPLILHDSSHLPQQSESKKSKNHRTGYLSRLKPFTLYVYQHPAYNEPPCLVSVHVFRV